MRRLLGLYLLFCTVTQVPGQIPGRGWRFRDRPTPVSSEPEPLGWGYAAAAHLMRRAGFSAPPSEIQRIADQGLEATLDELLGFETVDDSAFEQSLQDRAYPLIRYNQNNDARPDVVNLQRWWLYRMVNSRRQLVEKMTFFWHDHFATSILQVNQVNGSERPLMLVQNETLRRNALGSFKQMLLDVARDPAMILWLDNFTNVVGKPNENWARELMELFTMGEGSGYTEKDIQEAARAFTGWTLNRRTSPRYDFVFSAQAHDFQPKVVLGQTIISEGGDRGIVDGQRVIDIILEQDATAEFVVRKLWEYFVYPSPSAQIVRDLAQTFRASDYEIKPLMRAIFQHPHFLSVKAYRSKIKSPTELVAGLYRELGISESDNLPILMEPLGQSLFVPPDVGGWTQDIGWINTGTLLARYNFTNYVSTNRPGARVPGGDRRLLPDGLDMHALISANQLGSGANVVDYFLRTLVQDDVSVDTRYALEQYMESADDGATLPFDISNAEAVDKKVRGVLYLISLLPAYQLN